MGRANRILIADTWDPQQRSRPARLARALAECFEGLQVLPLTLDPDLALVWRDLQQTDAAVVLVFDGSLRQDLADLAHDWHMPLLLTLPIQADGLAAAFVALARLAKAQVWGVVLCGSEPPPELPEGVAGIPVLGFLGDTGELIALDDERLRRFF